MLLFHVSNDYTNGPQGYITHLVIF